MQATAVAIDTSSYAKCIENSKRIRWDTERDVIRGRQLDPGRKFLPDGLSLVGRLPFLDEADKRLFSQVQGRSYANIFGLVERFIAAKVLEVSRQHWMGDQTALEALVRFTDEELKHQAMFRRVEQLAAAVMSGGYRFLPDSDEVARVVLSKSTWSVLGLTCFIEIFTQVHYKASIADDPQLSPLWKDVFLFHWKEESQHAILDELEWEEEDNRLTEAERDAAVDDLIALVGAVDGILQLQAGADADYFFATSRRDHAADDAAAIRKTFLDAYRWQYIVSGVQEPRFQRDLFGKIDEAQKGRVLSALSPLMS
jgi:P-aminobenzoate N-oxygenase AurF